MSFMTCPLWSRFIRSTSVVQASSGSGPCHPSAFIHGGLPVAGGVSIKEIWSQAADAELIEELTEVCHGHPVKPKQ